MILDASASLRKVQNDGLYLVDQTRAGSGPKFVFLTRKRCVPCNFLKFKYGNIGILFTSYLFLTKEIKR